MTKKIVDAACRIDSGSRGKLHLGNIAIQRDWGWAPEYVEAMWLMLQQDVPDDFVIAKGESHELEDFVETAFLCVGLNCKDHIKIDAELFRSTDIMIGRGNPAKAYEKLEWQARYGMKDVVRMMVEAEQMTIEGIYGE